MFSNRFELLDYFEEAFKFKINLLIGQFLKLYKCALDALQFLDITLIVLQKILEFAPFSGWEEKTAVQFLKAFIFQLSSTFASSVRFKHFRTF